MRGGGKRIEPVRGPLAALTNLRLLKLNANPLGDRPWSISRLAPTLEGLDLSDTQVTDAHLLLVAGLPRLTMLDLSHTAVTDNGVQSLAGLKLLKVLSLDGTQVRGAGLHHLDGQELRNLNLAGSPIEDDALTAIGRFKLLKTLNLKGTPVTDDGLSHLHALPRLHHVVLEHTRVTSGGVAALVQARSGKLDARFSPPPAPHKTGGGGFF